MNEEAAQAVEGEATFEPRLIMKGDNDEPFVEGAFCVAAYQRGYRWGRDEVHQLLDDTRAHAQDAEKRRVLPTAYYCNRSSC